MTNTDKLTEFLLSTMNETKSFVVEQAPDVARQMLEYGFISEAIKLFVSILFIILGCFIINLAIKVRKEGEYNSDEASILLYVLATIVILPCFLIGMSCLDEMIKIKVSPKVYLIQQIKGRQ